ncbi:MAG: 5,6-dimethylbenzimidazole synthase [Planctomycetes bacterium ADurb.Bin412]|nr:MAG: 5,6-dimethylbenzimidazole synthase [Planctomycetes bacterium ADurb.Bin412]
MEVYQAIQNRRSVRAYNPRPIPEATLHKVLEALRLAPSACNFQPWRFLLVQDPQLRQKVAAASCNQAWMAEAPVIVVACGTPAKAYKKMGGYGSSIDIDLAIALDHLSLAAVAEGLGTCWIGAFDETAVKTLLQIPAEAKVVAMMPLGYPRSDDLNHPVKPGARKKADEIFKINQYQG